MREDAMKLLHTIASHRSEDYAERVVGRVEPEENEGVGVSTVLSPDWGYETALLDAKGAHPVERYPTREAAEAGHLRWIEKSKHLAEVFELGYGSVTESHSIDLARGRMEGTVSKKQ